MSLLSYGFAGFPETVTCETVIFATLPTEVLSCLMLLNTRIRHRQNNKEDLDSNIQKRSVFRLVGDLLGSAAFFLVGCGSVFADSAASDIQGINCSARVKV